jgi:archaemetzincin
MRFAPPSREERLAAVGSTAELPLSMRQALESGDDFEPIPVPGPHDWLANHSEPGQTYDDFVRSRPHRPDARRHTIYLEPLGEFATDDGPPLDRLREFAAAFFCLSVVTLAPLTPTEGEITARRNPYTGQRQLLTTDVLALLRQRLPQDAYAMVGITMEDLYPEPSWNFVFGQASLGHRVGVYSFARYHPRSAGGRPAANWRSLLLRRSCKVLAHETAHMFGIGHCTFYHCLMNGSNHIAESDARPMHLCPIDLRKLHDSVGFDVADHYQRLRGFCERVGFTDEARWLAKRLAHVTG